ncbi:hypothetical protein K1719_044934 [Acacia pycnantha]|nr:hypothetical protein K1719_044934 [Acacia pycnantha]
MQVGCRHFDTAKIYGSEEAVGSSLNKAMKEGIIEREDIFLTSKLWGSDHHDPVSALKQTLRNVRMEYLDMYLVHWPVKLKPWVNYPVPNEEDFEKLDIESTWIGMQKCFEMGLCRCIGVSNFSSTKIEKLLDFSSTPPAVNQVEMHPIAYSPLGGPENAWGSTAVVDHPTIQSIASKPNSTPAQVALRWGLSKGSSVIVKSFNEERMNENIASFELNLEEEEMTIQQLWDDEI